jgi:excisionase family DNA binding protein
MSEYVNAAEAAEILGCSESHVRRHIQSGTLSATKAGNKWQIARADLEGVSLADTAPSVRSSTRPSIQPSETPSTHPSAQPSDTASIRPSVHPSITADWRDDLLAQVARLEADKVEMHEEAGRREGALHEDVRQVKQEMGLRIEASKARVVDLESAATMREGRIVDMEATHADALATRDAELSDLRGQVSNLEADLRESHSRAEANALGWATRADELSHRIADLVDKHQHANERVYELEPVADQVPMLQAAVEEKDATLSERERELGQFREDIEAIASRPVAGPVFRLLTKGKLRF